MNFGASYNVLAKKDVLEHRRDFTNHDGQQVRAF